MSAPSRAEAAELFQLMRPGADRAVSVQQLARVCEELGAEVDADLAAAMTAFWRGVAARGRGPPLRGAGAGAGAGPQGLTLDAFLAMAEDVGYGQST